MRAPTLSVIVLHFGAISFAQDLTTLPKCAQAAALQGVTASGCGTDATCLCNNAGFVSSLKATIGGSCTGSDQQAACDWGNAACKSSGVSIDCSIYAASVMTTTPVAGTNSVSLMTSMTSMSSTGMSSMISSTTDMGTGSMTKTSSMTTSMTGTGSTMSSMMSMSTTIMSMTTSTTLSGNETMLCTHGCGNHTLAATSMMSKTASGPTSQYTGSANTAARHCGVIGIVAGVALLGALL